MLEFFIEGYRADISEEISSLLTFSIDDVVSSIDTSLGDRKTGYSKTIVLPGTARNNKLLGFIFKLNTSNPYDATLPNIGFNFNVSKSADCALYQGGLLLIKGTMQLLEIINIGGNVEYEVFITGELGGLTARLHSSKLTDLDYSSYDHAFTIDNIVNSWSNINGAGYYYPLIDYGGYSINKHDWDYRTFRPALYAKDIIDKIFTAAGYTYECDLFNTSRFRSAIIPHNRKLLTNQVFDVLSAARTSSANVIDSGTSTQVNLQWSSVVSTLFTASLSNSRFTYTGSDTVNLNLTFNLTGNYKAATLGYNLSVRKNGVVIPGTLKAIAQSGTTTQLYYSWSGSAFVSLSTNDYIEFFFQATTLLFGSDYIKATVGNVYLKTTTAVAAPVELGTVIQMNDAIPQNILQRDFLASIVKLFNLYITEDNLIDKHLVIAPYVDFYSTDTANSVNWSNKIDRSSSGKSQANV